MSSRTLLSDHVWLSTFLCFTQHAVCPSKRHLRYHFFCFPWLSLSPLTDNGYSSVPSLTISYI
jgi:hypothetical protein